MSRSSQRLQHVTGRPYPATGLSTERWATIRPRWVRVSSVVWTDQPLSLLGLLHVDGGAPSYTGDRWPNVVVHDGRCYLEDGHHRYALAVLARRRWIKARVWRR